MKLLLDTHIFLWWMTESPELTDTFRSAVTDARNEVGVSSITIAEIAIKQSIGKLQVSRSLDEIAEQAEFTPVPFTQAHARRLAQLPMHHRDPFDRMLLAQAQVDEWTFVTQDERCRRYDVQLLQ